MPAIVKERLEVLVRICNYTAAGSRLTSAASHSFIHHSSYLMKTNAPSMQHALQRFTSDASHFVADSKNTTWSAFAINRAPSGLPQWRLESEVTSQHKLPLPCLSRARFLLHKQIRQNDGPDLRHAG